MTIKRAETADGVTLTLEGESELRDAAVLKQALLEAADRGLPATLEMNGLASVHFNVLQVVYSGWRTLAEAGVAVTVRARAASRFAQAASEAGLPPLGRLR